MSFPIISTDDDIKQGTKLEGQQLQHHNHTGHCMLNRADMPTIVKIQSQQHSIPTDSLKPNICIDLVLQTKLWRTVQITN